MVGEVHIAGFLMVIVIGAVGIVSKDARTWKEKAGVPNII